MKNTEYWLIVFLILLSFGSVSAQDSLNNTPKPVPTPVKTPSNAEPQTAEVPRERREQAYAKLLEGQRYIWGLSNARTPAAISAGTRLAKDSILKAIEFDPTLAEGYTALAELTYQSPPYDLDEAVKLAATAVRINPDNFGGHQILARLYTIKSGVNRGAIDQENLRLAIKEWEEVGRLDPRNAEAFAFLSDFYGRTNQPDKQIGALKKWLSSATPINTRFYRGVMQQEDLSPEGALVKLGAAQLKAGETKEAVEILSRAVADDPNNDEAIELLNRSIETADNKTAATAIESLHQAIFANPENTALPVLLAQIQARSGNLDEAVKLLNGTILKLEEKDKISAANMRLALGDLLAEADRFDEAAATYKNALATRGIGKDPLVTDDDRDFAIRVYQKLIQTYKYAGRPEDVRSATEAARLLLGKDDLFADEQLISFYQETGRKAEALQIIRTLRIRYPEDYGLLRKEAAALTDLGKVDEGVGLLQALIGKKPAANDSSKLFAEYDDFINYLYISGLYSSAKRGSEAVAAANQAIQAAKRDDRKQIARVTLATAQQMAGDFAGAETTLREILKQTPGYPSALNNLGYFLAERNEKLNEALELIQKAVAIDPTNPSYLDSLGWVYFKLDKLDEAERYLKSAIRLSSGSPTVFEHLGDVYQKQEKPEMARSVWQKALKLSSENETIKRLKTKLQIKK